ncbi:3324_t:CDS:1, partial [Funneliformis caledonium]
FEEINDELIYKKDFDIDTIKYAILSKLNPKYLGLSPEVIILEL